jgi:hypothetical protein
VFQNSELFPTQVSLYPEKSTLVYGKYENSFKRKSYFYN